MHNNLEIRDIIKNLVPLFCNKYWFVTSYLLLMALSGYIQRLLDSLTRKEFKHLISILALFVIIAPTVFMLEIFKDSGKGFMNMLTVYLSGRYMALYGFPDFIRKWHRELIPGLILLIFCFNEILVLVGLPQLFARDNNLLIVVLAVSIFYYTLQRQPANSRIVNKMAGYVLPVYIIHIILLAPVCRCLSGYMDVYPLFIVAAAVPLLFIISIVIEELRRRILSPVFDLINSRLTAIVGRY